jgi:hypothetical protein
MEKTEPGNYRIPGPAADGIDHDYDEFLLWFNPTVNVTVDATNNAQWQMGTFGDGLIIIQPVCAATGSTFAYSPPLTPQDAVPVRIYSQSNSVTNTATKTVEVDMKRGFGLTVSIGARDVFHAKVTTTAIFDWKSTASRGQRLQVRANS